MSHENLIQIEQGFSKSDKVAEFNKSVARLSGTMNREIPNPALNLAPLGRCSH